MSAFLVFFLLKSKMARLMIRATIIVERIAATIMIVDLSLSLLAYWLPSYGIKTVSGDLISGGIVSVFYKSGSATTTGIICYGVTV